MPKQWCTVLILKRLERYSSDKVDTIVVVVEAEIKKPAVKLVENPVEQSFPNFRCDQCTFTNETLLELSQNVYVRMKHRIFQVDVNTVSLL